MYVDQPVNVTFMQTHVILNMYLHVGACIKILHHVCIIMFSSAACGAFEHHCQFSEVSLAQSANMEVSLFIDLSIFPSVSLQWFPHWALSWHIQFLCIEGFSKCTVAASCVSHIRGIAGAMLTRVALLS